jgi:hypothetical protein
MANFDIYSLPHNDLDAALAFADQHWRELRPEDFTTLARLNEAHSAELFQGLADLKQRKGGDGSERHGTVTHRRLRRLRYRSVLYVAAGKKPPLTKWVRVLRKRDGKIIQVRRGRETDKSKYKLVKPGTPLGGGRAAKPVKKPARPVKAPSTQLKRTVKQKLVERAQRRTVEKKKLKSRTTPVTESKKPKLAPPVPPPPTERPPLAIGKTKSGKSIYAPSEALNHAHQRFLKKGKPPRAERERANDLLDDHFDHYEGLTAQDHHDAAKLHRHHAKKLEQQWRKLVGRKGKPPKDKRDEADALGQQMHAHRGLAGKHEIREKLAKPSKAPKSGKSPKPGKPPVVEEDSPYLQRAEPGEAHGRSWTEKPVYREVPKKPPEAPSSSTPPPAPAEPKPRKIQVVVTDEAGQEHLVDMGGETPVTPAKPSVTPKAEKPAAPKPEKKPVPPKAEKPAAPKPETPKAPESEEVKPTPPPPKPAPPPPPKPAAPSHPHTPATPVKKKVKIIVTDPDGTEREIDPDADESMPESKAAAVLFYRRVPYVPVRHHSRRRSVK